MQVIYSPNGNTAVFEDGEQVPELQESWIITHIEFLESKDIDVESLDIILPSGMHAKVFSTSNGYNWRVYK